MSLIVRAMAKLDAAESPLIPLSDLIPPSERSRDGAEPAGTDPHRFTRNETVGPECPADPVLHADLLAPSVSDSPIGSESPQTQQMAFTASSDADMTAGPTPRAGAAPAAAGAPADSANPRPAAPEPEPGAVSLGQIETARAAAPAPPGRRSTQQHAKRLLRTGGFIVLGALVPIGLWMCLAPLSMAVVAPAHVKVDLNRRPVQHLEGGIVSEVLVRNGQQVKAGDPLLVLGDVRVKADRNRLQYRVTVQRAALVRYEAEQALSPTLVFPEELTAAAQSDERIDAALRKETALFNARRDALDSEVALMKARRRHVQQEIRALRAQLGNAKNSLALQRKELAANQQLVNKHFVSRAHVIKMESQVADYAADLEEQRSALARASQNLVDSELRIKTAENNYVSTATDQIRSTSAEMAEVEQELRTYQDAAERQVVTAPASGEIIDLQFTSPGAVVGAGEPIAEIVPGDTKLVIEARIRPEDVSFLQHDQLARIKFTAFKYRNAKMVQGNVSYISGDRLLDPATQTHYYSVMITADAESLEATKGLKLQAGMPAEVYIEGTQQTAFEYLIEPITSIVRKSAREL